MRNRNANAESLIQLALKLFSENQLAGAETHCREALMLDSTFIGAYAVLGAVLHAQTRYEEAEKVFTTLTQLDPADSMHWMNVGTARRCNKRYDEALGAYARAAELGARSADFYYNVALTHMDRKDYESARAVLQRARALAPLDAEICYRYALCCNERMDSESAIDALVGWEQFDDLTSATISSIGSLLMNLGEVDRAEVAIRRAMQEGATDPQTLLTLAQLMERTNRVADAREIIETLRKRDHDAQLQADLASLQANVAQRESRHEIAVELFRTALSGCQDFHRRQFYQFPLAKSLDALGRYDEAFATLVEAHAAQVDLVRLSMPVLYARGAPTMTITEFSCDSLDIASWKNDGPSTEESPIFIVAFPRSGTTLLETALDAHPQMRSMDEQPYLQNALDDIQALGVRYPSELGALQSSQLNEVRKKYWARTRRKIQLRPGERLIDKNPLNILRLPVIRRLFPNAKILLAIRHPCDVILSCFMQHFRAPDFVLLCRDLPSLANGYRRAFDFWHQQAELLHPQVFEIRYETFVDDFEAQIRAVIDFLELPWNDRVLKPGERALEKRFISTPSYSQVVQPINKRAVGRWKSYEQHFKPVLPTLQPYLNRWGYEV